MPFPYPELQCTPVVVVVDIVVALARTLNNNNLTWLRAETFSGLTRLRALRLSENALRCDCHLSWLARWLRRSPRLALYTRCASPPHLQDLSVADLHDNEFSCAGQCRGYSMSKVTHASTESPSHAFIEVIKRLTF